MEEHAARRLSRSAGRKFAFTLAGAFGVLALVAYLRHYERLSVGFGALTLLLAVAAVLIPQHLGPVERLWMKFGMLLSRITSPVFLGIVYFVVFTPTGLIRRMLGRNSVVHALINNSYWQVRAPLDAAARKARMERQF